VRITAQLVDGTTGSHLWAERYDRELHDLFVLQDEITQKILTALRVTLTPEEQAQLRNAPTANLEAYDYYLRGTASFWTYTEEANAQARQMFEKAVALDPQYAAAYAALSLTHMMDWLYWDSLRFPLEQILTLAQRAVELDGSLPLSHSVLVPIRITTKVLYFRGKIRLSG
jgi:adenylate cyclase